MSQPKSIATWRERVAHLDRPTDFAERGAAIEEAKELRSHLSAVEAERDRLSAEVEALRADAGRYRWLRFTLHHSVGGGVEVNDERLVYEEPEPGEAVRVFWYPNTPVGFNDSKADTLDEAIDAAMRKQGMSTDRHHLERLLRALAGPESELVAAIEAATAHIAQTPDPLDAVEVKDSTMGEWLDPVGSGAPNRAKEADTMFLTADELVELTGYSQKSKQIQHLKQQRIPFHVNRAGQPRVARAILEARPAKATERPAWSPAWAANQP